MLSDDAMLSDVVEAFATGGVARAIQQFGLASEQVWDLIRREQSETDRAKRSACYDIGELWDDGSISDAAATAGFDAVEALFGPDTVAPSVIPEDQGVDLYWAAEEMSITIFICGVGDDWWSVRGIGHPYSGSGCLPIAELRASVAQFSAEVARRNQNWRETVDENRS